MNERWITAAIGVLTLIGTLITAIPGFKQLAADRAHVYYDVSALSILNPNSPDLPRVRKALRDNKIPDSTVAIHITNTGQGPAKEVKLRVLVTGEMTANDVEFIPARSAQPIWLELPEAPTIGSDGATATAEFRNFAPKPILTVIVRYHSRQATLPDDSRQATLPVTVEVYYDGKPAQAIADVTAAPRHTALSEFVLPLEILGGGILLIGLATVVIVFARHREVAQEFKHTFRESLPYPLNLFL